MAKMGCPSLGEHTQVEVVIEESYEFKVCFLWGGAKREANWATCVESYCEGLKPNQTVWQPSSCPHLKRTQTEAK